MTVRYTAHVDTFTRDGLPSVEASPTLVFDLPELHYPDRLNAAAVLLDESLERFGARPCVHTEDGVWTYRELTSRADKIARVLVDDFGLVPGNRVLLRGANSPELIACWFAVLKAGGVAVATMPLLRSAELAEIIERAQISYALSDARIADELTCAQHLSPELREVCTFGLGGQLAERVAGKEAGFGAVQTAADDPALIAFTSGTTGSAKGCVHFHRDLLAVCDTYARHIVGPSPEDVFTGTPPIGFTFGLGGLVLFPLRFGASTVPIERPAPDALLQAIRAHGITVLFTAPTAYRAMLRHQGLADVTSLHTCVAAGEPLPAATSDAWFERTGIRILDGIGSTEMLHIFISSPSTEVRPGSTGRPVPGYEAMVVDEHMHALPAGAVGRLVVRGPTGCRYLSDERQSAYVVDGWNLTGDAFLIDEDGYFWFQARADDMIISSGYNISGLEVEGVLLQHHAVQECAVVAALDDDRGHVVKAFVVPAPDVVPGPELVEALQNFVKARIAPYKYPRQIAFIEDLPKTHTGKIQRYRLREADRSTAGAGAPP